MFKGKHVAKDEALVKGKKDSAVNYTPIKGEERSEEEKAKEKEDFANKDPREILTVKVEGIEDGKPIKSKYAYCVGKEGKGKNIRPAILWNGMPKGTKSFAVIVVDGDVPTDFADANQQGKIIPATQPRQDFIHYALVDIPTDIKFIEEGTGRGTEKTPASVGKAAINDYASFMPDAKPAEHIGWDGPCPPWNDEMVHNYQFKVYALKVENLGLKDGFTAKEAYAAVKENAIDEVEIVGLYTRNK